VHGVTTRLNRLKERNKLPLTIIITVISCFALYCCLIHPRSRTDLGKSGINIRILLATALPGDALQIDVNGPYKVFEGPDPKPYSAPGNIFFGYRLGNGKATFQDGSGICINGKAVHTSEVLIVPEREGDLSNSGIRYSGAFEINVDESGSLRLINTLDIERYLAGVLFKEMPTSFSDEALKAQLVAARTYALYRISHGRRMLTDDVRSQVYGGLSAESARGIGLIQATHGEVLTFGGEVIPAFFSSTCGGITAGSSDVFEGEAPFPVNQSVVCGYCLDSRFYRWEAGFSTDEIRNSLGLPGDQALFEISVTGVNRSKRATEISILDGRGGIIIKYTASRFRSSLNRGRSLKNKMLSLMIEEIKKTSDGFVIHGRGWGHGVGLCQYGAQGLAESGKSYRAILEYYYKDASLVSDYGRK